MRGMATYAIGDVQGCARSLEQLLAHIGVDFSTDRVWLAGDLVNRGPHSLDVLQFCKRHDRQMVCVLGNHDLQLLARWKGVGRNREKDTLKEILHAPDRDELLQWLIERPLVHAEESWLLLHAGVSPTWNRTTLLARTEKAQERLRGGDSGELLRLLARKDIASADASLTEDAETIRTICYLRCTSLDGVPDFSFAGPPEEAPASLYPWYAHPNRKELGARVVCGHWAAQGLLETNTMVSLDTGCVWGGQLTAMRLDDSTFFEVECADDIDPKLRVRWPKG